MRQRPSARLLVLDPDDRVLLFRFGHKHGPLGGRDYWATPGGAVEAEETYTEAARRELFEETGIAVDTIGPQVAEREFVLQLSGGADVLALERFFLVRTADQTLSNACWTPEEIEVMADHRWWSTKDLMTIGDLVFPTDLAEILASVGVNTGE